MYRCEIYPEPNGMQLVTVHETTSQSGLVLPRHVGSFQVAYDQQLSTGSGLVLVQAPQVGFADFTERPIGEPAEMFEAPTLTQYRRISADRMPRIIVNAGKVVSLNTLVPEANKPGETVPTEDELDVIRALMLEIKSKVFRPDSLRNDGDEPRIGLYA